MARQKMRILIGIVALAIAIAFSVIFFGDKFNEEVKSVSQLGRGEVLKLTPSVSSEYSKFNLRMQFSYDGKGKSRNYILMIKTFTWVTPSLTVIFWNF